MDDIEQPKLRFKAIIPCCGYGTRVGMKPNESKELLPNPTTGEPLIKWHIDLCKKYDIDPVFIVRPEKTDLIEYLKDHEVVLYQPVENEEWMDTIYKNKEHFGQKNILLLPDTVFGPDDTIEEMKKHLEWLELVCLTHEVEDPTKWGVIDEINILEKPASTWVKTAWGVIGFDISIIDIFKQMAVDKKAYIAKLVKHNISLDAFEDLTRK